MSAKFTEMAKLWHPLLSTGLQMVDIYTQQSCYRDAEIAEGKMRSLISRERGKGKITSLCVALRFITLRALTISVNVISLFFGVRCK